MRKFGIKFQRIDIVLISHMHGDHYFGLMGMLSTMHLLGRVKPLVIYGPTGLEEVVRLHMKLANSHFGYDLIFQELKDGQVDVLYEDAKIEIRCFPLVHKIPTSGFLITEKQKDAKLDKAKADEHGLKIEYYHLLKKGVDVETEEGGVIKASDYTIESPPAKTYAYCSDTAYNEGVIPFIEGVDVLYHEATFTDAYIERAHKTKHSTAAEAALIAKKASVGKLLIGHISARFDTGEIHLEEARKEFAETFLAEDGAEFRL